MADDETSKNIHKAIIAIVRQLQAQSHEILVEFLQKLLLNDISLFELTVRKLRLEFVPRTHTLYTHFTPNSILHP